MNRTKMHRTGRITSVGAVAIFAACVPHARACSSAGATAASLCCSSDLSKSTPPTSHLTTPPTAPLAHSAPLSGPGVSGGSTQDVHVFNFDYSIDPPGNPIVDATINVGDTVHWIWDSGFHSVTSVIGSVEVYNSGVLGAPNGVFDHTFTQAGLYYYYCTPHGFDNGDGTADGMAGTITVVPATINSTWNVDFDGSWQTATNWTNNAIPNGAGHVANFGAAISGPRGVLVDAPTTVGSINFDSPSPKSYLIAGSSTLSLNGASGAAANVNVLDGSHTITTRLHALSDATFNISGATSTLTVTSLQTTTAALTKAGAGTLVVNHVRAGALNVATGTVVVQSNGGDSGASRVGTFSIAGGSSPVATIDLKNNDLIVTNGSVGEIQAQITSARNGGAWDQPGITSSAARTANPKNTTLGLLSGTEYRSLNGPDAMFAGFAVADTDVLVKYTYYGDTDFNGTVNFDDYSRTDAGFNNNRSGWLNGDFDFNNTVNFDDYALIDLAFNTQNGVVLRAIAWLDGSDRSDRGMDQPALQMVQLHFAQFGDGYATSFLNAVPEPSSTLAISGLGALAVSNRRRRRRTS